jgi:hypothetical protein
MLWPWTRTESANGGQQPKLRLDATPASTLVHFSIFGNEADLVSGLDGSSVMRLSQNANGVDGAGESAVTHPSGGIRRLRHPLQARRIPNRRALPTNKALS